MEIGNQEETEETTPDDFQALPQARPPALESELTADNIKRCVHRERLDLESLSGVYSSPEDLVADQVETSRELEFERPAVELLDPEAFAGEVESREVQISEDDEVATKLIAWALGVTRPGLNVNHFLKGEGSGLVAGFYDPISGRTVIEKKGKLDTEYVVMAHEFTHAATDQAFGLPKPNLEPILDDISLAEASLVEGDAVLSALRVLSHLAPRKSVEKSIAAQIAFEDDFSKEREAGVPYLLIDTALFPYRWGLSFACRVFEEKGWQGINRMYSKPPTSSAQILFPERWVDGEEPRKTPRLVQPGSVWDARDQGQFGAAHLKALFEAPGDDEKQSLSRPLSRAASWAGGFYKVWTVGLATGEYALGLSLVEHEEFDGLLCSSMNKWYRAAFPDAEPDLVGDGVLEFAGHEHDAVLSCQGRNVMIGIGPFFKISRAIIGLGPPVSY